MRHSSWLLFLWALCLVSMAEAQITYRSTKGAPLTHQELDNNFHYLEDAVGALQGVSSNPSSHTISVPANTRPASPAVGRVIAILDGSTPQDCTIGGGSTIVQCRWDGTTWRAFGDGNTAGSGGAPDSAQYVLTAPNATLTGARLLGTSVIMEGTHAARPPAGTSGRLYFYTDAPFGWSRDTGVAWADRQLDWSQITARSIATTDLNFDVATQTELNAHASDSTGIHGIADTAALVLTTDPRMSDTRTPADNSVTSAKILNSTILEEDLNSSLLGPANTVYGLRKLGTGPMEALPGTHVSVTNARDMIGATTSCTDNQIPKVVSSVWTCAADAGVGGGVASVEGLTGALDLTTGTTGTAPTFSGSGTTITLNIPAASDAGTTAGTLSNMAYVRIPTTDEKAGLAAGSPSAANPVITQNHASVTNARTPTAHAASHFPAGTDDISSIYATRAYADSIAAGLQPKARVQAATTGALPSNTYNNGTAGVGATLTATANGALVAQDGVTLTVNQDLLVKDQAAGLQNGIYRLTQVGTAGTPYILTRRTDLDQDVEVNPGVSTFVDAGTANGGKTFFIVTVDPITVGTTAIAWDIFQGGGGSGEANTATNVGAAGVGVFKQKTGVNLEFKKLNPGSTRLSITDDTGNSEVDFDIVEANLSLASMGGMATKAQVNDAGTWNVSEIPNLPATIITSGTLAPTVGGTGGNNTATSGRYLKGDGSAFVTSAGAASGVGSCTNQVVTATNSDAAPTCVAVSSPMVADGTLVAADLSGAAEILKTQITDTGTWAEPEIPVLTTAKYPNALLLDGSRIAAKVVVDDTAASPVADRQIQTKGGLLQIADTSGMEGRYLDKDSIEVLVTDNYGDASVTQTKLLHGTTAGDANTLTLHDFCAGSPNVGDVCVWNGTSWAFSGVCTGGASTPLGGSNQLLGMNNAGSNHEFKDLLGTANQVTVTHNVGSMTLSLPQPYGTTSTPTLGGLTLAQGPITSDQKALTASATWNQAATIFNMVSLNITDTASAATSSAIQVVTNGGTEFRVQKDGLTEVTALGTGVVVVTFGMSPYQVPRNVTNVLCDSTGGAITINAPSAGVTEGRMLMIKKINTGTNPCTVNRTGSDDFEEVTSFVLSAKYEFKSMVSGLVGGTRWYFTGGL